MGWNKAFVPKKLFDYYSLRIDTLKKVEMHFVSPVTSLRFSPYPFQLCSFSPSSFRRSYCPSVFRFRSGKGWAEYPENCKMKVRGVIRIKRLKDESWMVEIASDPSRTPLSSNSVTFSKNSTSLALAIFLVRVYLISDHLVEWDDHQ